MLMLQKQEKQLSEEIMPWVLSGHEQLQVALMAMS